MINLFNLKKQKKEQESSGEAASGGAVKKSSAALLRVTKDVNELTLPSTCEVDFPDPNNLLDFRLIISPDEGFHRGGRFVFSFKISQGYPHDAPKIKCLTKVYHPNIDLEGNVCLNILREDWKPVFSISTVVLGLQYLFLEPNPDDPLNKEAAEVLVRNRKMFETNVMRAMKGGVVNGVAFERCLK